jgi:small subunit ribosomal protein S3
VGQKVHPLGFRLGIFRDWRARWFANRKQYGAQVIEDLRIRKFLEEFLGKADISKIEIEKAGENLRVLIFTSKPGSIIGKQGQGIDALRTELVKRFKKSVVEISVQEIKKPELDATLIAKDIAQQLEKRIGYKRAMKKAVSTAMRGGINGVKIRVAGRLQGAEIARAEWLREGSIPLHTLRKDIDYGFAEAYTTYGQIGVKVWICRGDIQQTRS